MDNNFAFRIVFEVEGNRIHVIRKKDRTHVSIIAVSDERKTLFATTKHTVIETIAGAYDVVLDAYYEWKYPEANVPKFKSNLKLLGV